MEGYSIRKICRDPDMPARSTIYKWIIEDKNFSDQYTQAKRIQAHSLVDEMVDLADISDPLEAGKTRIQIDTRKWFASKVLPKIYGDKLDLTTDGEKISAPTVIAFDKETQDLIQKTAQRKKDGQ